MSGGAGTSGWVGAGGQRWSARPRSATLVRAAVLVVPLLAAVAAGAGAAALLQDRPWRLPAVLALSTVVLVVLDRLARRLLPLTVLLRLSLLFPDRAPNRFRLALRAGSTRALVRTAGTATPQAQAAREVLVLLARTACHDRPTRRHSERVRAYVDLLAEALRLPAADAERLRWAALLHDIGKVAVPARILNKPSRLDEPEWQQVRRHPEEGARLAVDLRPFLGPWFDAIGQHHERWDGGGYPAGLVGKQISYGARIVAVADAFEVMTAPRSYKPATGLAAARAELVACGGTQFDPDVVRAMLGISLERLQRVLGPPACLAVLPFAAPGAGHGAAGTPGLPQVSPPDAAPAEGALTPVGLHPDARLAAGSGTDAAAHPAGHDAGGGAKVTGHHDGSGHEHATGVDRP